MKILKEADKDSIKKQIISKWKEISNEADFFSGNSSKVGEYLGYDVGYFSEAISSVMDDMKSIAKEIDKLEEQYNR